MDLKGTRVGVKNNLQGHFVACATMKSTFEILVFQGIGRESSMISRKLAGIIFC